MGRTHRLLPLVSAPNDEAKTVRILEKQVCASEAQHESHPALHQVAQSDAALANFFHLLGGDDQGEDSKGYLHDAVNGEY